MILYYQSGAKSMTMKDVRELGLGYAFEDGVTYNRVLQGGPDGGRGVVFCEAGGDSRYDPGSQEWHRYPGRDDLWIGWRRDARPGPAELARKNGVRGYPVRLADGREWMIPVAVLPGLEPALPRLQEWDGEEWTLGRVQDKYRRYWDTAMAIFEKVRVGLEDGETEISVDTQDLSAQAMTLNYRVGPAEISALGLWDENSDAEIAMAAINWNVWRDAMAVEAEKKSPEPNSE
jgi:hypothetical protein